MTQLHIILLFIAFVAVFILIATIINNKDNIKNWFGNLIK
jgi:hypothetical protein